VYCVVYTVVSSGHPSPHERKAKAVLLDTGVCLVWWGKLAATLPHSRVQRKRDPSVQWDSRAVTVAVQVSVP
jgi:hypothetical protein